MANSGFGRRFHDLKEFEVVIFFLQSLCIQYKPKGNTTKMSRRLQFNVNLSY